MFRKAGSLLAALTIVLSMSFVVFGAGKITSIESGVFVSDISFTEGDTKYTVGNQITDIDGSYRPGDVVNIFLDPSKFTGTDINYIPENGMSARELENAGVSFKYSSEKNNKLIKDVVYKEKQLNGKQVALVQLQLADTTPTTADSKEFTTKITLYADKVKQQEITVYGTVENDVQIIKSGEEYAFLGDGSIAEAGDNIPKIEIDAGKDVSLTAKLYKGKRYYAVATDKPTDADINIMSDYGDVQIAYTLETEGFLETDVTVKIKFPDKMYVYDGNGKYLGTTDESLALSKKYYLSSKEITMTIGSGTVQTVDVDKEPDNGEEPVPGDIIPDNSGSDIPGTGVGIGPKIAIGAIIIGLIAVGAVVFSSKKRQ